MSDHGLMFDALIYLAAAVAFVPVAKRLGLGSVLGYLSAGCIIGPFCLGLVTDVEEIMHFAEFGVVLMLFVIGLELDPKRLWGMRREVFGGGLLQMLGCGLVISAAILPLGLPMRGAVVVGLALALSSTAIAIQSLTERNLLSAPIGHTSFAVLLFQDIAAIPLIGLVPLLAAQRSEHAGGWLGIGKVLLAIVLVVVIGRYFTRPVMRVVARTDMRELFTAFALLLVVGISQVMAVAGVSMALGAFLAGVLLAGSEYRHALETDLEPFKGLLMGLFFMAVGMSVDFGLLAREPLLIGALLFGYVALKSLMLGMLAKPLGIAARQRWLFAGVIGQGGEFAFVVFGVARASRLLPGEWDARFTLVVALSMAVTPLFLLVHDKLAARAAANQTVEHDQIESEGAPVIMAGFGRFGQIVGRMLFANNIKATVLDHDPEQIELLRKFGFRVFYGDATRHDLLEAAGVAQARVLVNAIDDVEDSLALVDIMREHFPHVKIVARARNMTHYFELRERGVQIIERETFQSALVTGRQTLEALGVSAYEARERADSFRRHNIAQLEAVFPDYKSETHRLSASKAGREELQAQFERDQAALERIGTGGWHEELEALEAATDERASRVPDAPVRRG